MRCSVESLLFWRRDINRQFLVDLYREPFYPSSGHSTKHYQSLPCTAFYPTWFMSVDKNRCLKDRPKIMSSIDSLDFFPKQPHVSPGPNGKRCGTHRDDDGDPPVPYATGRRETRPVMSRLGRPSATHTVIPGELTHPEETTHFCISNFWC